jgi:FMN phosphatase YigB (HAD superfamily)
MKAIWYNPQGKPWAADGKPDAEVGSLTELPALLSRLS